jgi:Na+-translocating ferredoxin:NAD+ oxidoreductase RnfC subunit
MMGRLTLDVNEPVTKTNAGIIILPKDHPIVRRKIQPEENWHRIGKSACDQCSYCTELCPRYLLGYNVQPHKVMRSLVFTKTGESVWNQMAELCCACGLCTLYSCPEDLFPKEACDKAKVEMRKEGIKYKQTEHYGVHPMKEGRRVPLKQLIKRLNLQDYDVKTPFTKEELQTSLITLNLKQHAGEKSQPKVGLHDIVRKGELVAAPAEGKLGANIHSSIEGEVTEVTEDYIRIKG